MNSELFDKLTQVSDGIWELSKSYRKKMKVPVRIVATEKLLKEMDDGAVEQAINVSELPGIVEASLIMPDAHWGYGFAVGGVAAFDLENGIISPGGIGFDINCGMRLLTTNLTEKEVKPKIEMLVNRVFDEVPAGVGAAGKIRLSKEEISEISEKGAKWAGEHEMGLSQDIENIEENGCIKGAEAESVSERAFKRARDQLGTLGSGNHYLEIQKVDIIYDHKRAKDWGIYEVGQVCVMIHCGSRGFGHQIASDYLRVFDNAMGKYKIKVSDRQLACAPFNSDEGQRYFSAMAAAANYAFCNRQVITDTVRKVFEGAFGKSAESMEMNLIYDVAHNIAKIEEFDLGTKELRNQGTKELLVHRKGATRSYPGQPVIIGGSMETGSYLLVGEDDALKKTFGSTAHGSGRTMSRTQAKKQVHGGDLQKKMKEKGIYVKSATHKGLAEEAGFAYKDINEVVKAVSFANISQPVVSLKPLGNIKG